MAAKAFGKRLAQLRREKATNEERDIDRRDVAKAVGASPSSVTRWEAGEVFPGEDTMADLAKYFGVTKSWLRYGEGEKYALPIEAGELVAKPAPPIRAAAPSTKQRKGAR